MSKRWEDAVIRIKCTSSSVKETGCCTRHERYAEQRTSSGGCSHLHGLRGIRYCTVPNARAADSECISAVVRSVSIDGRAGIGKDILLLSRTSKGGTMAFLLSQRNFLRAKGSLVKKGAINCAKRENPFSARCANASDADGGLRSLRISRIDHRPAECISAGFLYARLSKPAE